MQSGSKNRRSGFALTVFIVSALQGVVSAASAQDAGSTGPWSLDFSFGERIAKLPTFDVPVGDTFIVGYPGLISEAFNPVMFGGEINARYRLSDRWQIEFGGGYWKGSDDVSAEPLHNNNTAFGLAVTDQTGSFGTILGASELEGQRVYASVDASILETRLRLVRSFRSGGVTISPFAGLVYDRSIQNYTASFRLIEPLVNDLETPYELAQKVDSSRFGGELGLKLNIPLAKRWHLDAGATFSLYNQDTSLNGHDCLAQASFSPGFDCEDTTAFSYTRFLDSTAHDSDERIAKRVKLDAGLSYVTSFGTIGISGFAQYDSDVAGVDNPLLTQDQFLGADPTRDVPSHLKFIDAWSYGGSLKVSIPLQ